MTAALPIAVANWVSTTTTVVTAVITLALCAVLTGHVLLTATTCSREEDDAEGASDKFEPSRAAKASRLRRSLARAAVPLGGWFAIVLLARAAIILIERPGP